MVDFTKVGAIVRELRGIAGWSQVALAAEAGIVSARVGALERGGRTSPLNLQLLADALDVFLEDFLPDEFTAGEVLAVARGCSSWPHETRDRRGSGGSVGKNSKAARRARARPTTPQSKAFIRSGAIHAGKPYVARPTLMTSREVAHTESTLAKHVRPKTRGGCVDGPRPCPYVSCKYNLFLEVTPTGGVRFTFPDKGPHEIEESCALDIADRGASTLEECGAFINITRERVRQNEAAALKKVGRHRTLGEFALQPEDDGL